MTILSCSSRNRIPRSDPRRYDCEPMSHLAVSPPFDLARTAAPAWWARGRWPNVDWRSGAFVWVGWDDGEVAWRSVRQVDAKL